MDLDQLKELALYQAWADAEHWRTLERFPAALKDEAIRNRLHHFHFVQSAFSWTVKADGSPGPNYRLAQQDGADHDQSNPDENRPSDEVECMRTPRRERSGARWTALLTVSPPDRSRARGHDVMQG